jgi:hypothetical protein
MPGKPPVTVNMSLWQTPQACTLMRTWRGLRFRDIALDHFEWVGIGFLSYSDH